MQTFRGYFLCCIFQGKIAIHFHYLPNCTAHKQKVRKFNSYSIRVYNLTIEFGMSWYYLCTFADPRQMEYMSTSVDCICFRLWNGLDRTSAVPGSTLGHSGELIPGYKPRYRLGVLLFHLRQEMAVCIRYNTSFPEMEVSGISSASLWTHK